MKFSKIKYIERSTGEIKIENVPGEGFLKFLYYNPLGELPLNLVVKKKFLSEIYGRSMDSSKSKGKILPFVEEHGINMEESVKGVDDFTSFNDFFVRKLKEGSRKIAQGEDEVASPADGKVLAYEDIKVKDEFFLKGDKFSLEEFLGDRELAQKYEGGVFLIVRLAPVDYHRFHFPIDGVVGSSKLIEGDYYSVSPHAIRRNFRIYCENKREYAELKNEKFGDVILSEIGATMVGGIEQTYRAGTRVGKGEEKGYFYFGGSSCILLFQKDRIKLDEDLLKNTKKGIETKVYMGERIAILK
ncbi:phosphatidylserine decarboxylase proenzyme [Propionigenium maris DSM 9537]|uniref:Phosphatidylserine decarboxylase proenzyme n=1 Tax=Propionigenium maris DSM 9537 TaxID=1123000 RepID=A0A9W6GPS0_9FUSO|nr:phosphatidylserine decarboxylase [Propionigenium maris]GLI58005.1 phosphatidylserine decarboxylase proenzyme [Propionigenium maris DSM 9537]